MAGNSDVPSDNPAAPDHGPTGAGGPKVKTFSCTNCGAPVTVKYAGLSLAISCPSCKSVIDLTDPNHAILSKYKAATDYYKSKIELGTRGKMFGKEWECIGFMVRADVASSYTWDEYLLFNPYYGYRWLTEAAGHWNFVTPLKEKPEVHSWTGQPSSSGARAVYKSENYKIFYSGQAQVWYVLGEFYWRVKHMSTVEMTDYISPPFMVSREADNLEVTWSQSEYIEPNVVKEAFGIRLPLNSRLDVGPNQPVQSTKVWEEMRGVWLLLFVVLMGIEFYHLSTATSNTCFDQGFTFSANTKKEDTTTPVFTVDRAMSNLNINITADVDNSWFWAAGELVNDDTGESYPFERTVEYYYGTDSDGFWSEGSRSNNFELSRVPGGKYYINFDTESGDFKQPGDHAFSFTVKRNVLTYANFLWALIFISIPPALAFSMSRGNEMSRWSQSDYNPYPQVSSSSD